MPRIGMHFAYIALFGCVVATAAAEGPLPTDIDRCPFSGRFPVEITLEEARDILWLADQKIDIDRVDGLIVTAYVDDEQFAGFDVAGFDIRAIPNQARRAWHESILYPKREDYHNYDALTAELQTIAANYPVITELFSVGQSVQGRELWMMKVSDNPTLDESEPEFMYSATMHGDEPVGTEMVIFLLRLLTGNYGVNPEYTALVDDLEMWFMPMHNPDGNAAGSRYNANGHDLNRSFPDPRSDPNDDPTGRPIEVQHMMYFQYDHNILQGGNYHGGALVVNYPWDTWYGQYTPDDDLIRNISLGYSFRNPPMWNSSSFPQGVVIGWEWYVIDGGMQDWAYHWRNEMQLTLEISDNKWPSSTQLPAFWDENRESMLWQIAQTRVGVEGFVTDAVDSRPIKAFYDVVEIGKEMWGEPLEGYYHRMLEPGTYAFEFSALGYEPATINGVTVVSSATTQLDVQLNRASWYTVSGVVTEEGTGLPLAATVTAYDAGTGETFQVATTNQTTGAYTMEVPAWEFDFVARAENHVGVTETRTISAPTTIDFHLLASRGSLLLVRDGNTDDAMADDLAELGYLVTEETSGSTNPVGWVDYDLLIWTAGSNRNPLTVAADRTAVEAYVAAGGHLLIEGGEVAYDALESPGYPSFATMVLHIADWDADNAGAMPLRSSQADHPIANAPNSLPTTLALTYDHYADQDAVEALVGTTVVYGTNTYADDAGILVHELMGGEGQIVFYAFDYAALTNREDAEDLLENTVDYLTRPSQGIEPRTWTESLRLSRPHPSVTRGPVVCEFALPAARAARVEIFDATGRRVRSLLDGHTAAGAHLLSWDGRDTAGQATPSGVYFLRAASGGHELSRRFVVVD